MFMSHAHRYLVRFGPKQTPHFFTDVLIIGGGIAGLRAALEAPPDMGVLVVTKDKVQLSNSSYAQGGIAGVLSPEDRFENHIEDTLAAGADLCDRDVVEMVVREAPRQIGDLVRFGTHFDEEDEDSFDEADFEEDEDRNDPSFSAKKPRKTSRKNITGTGVAGR